MSWLRRSPPVSWWLWMRSASNIRDSSGCLRHLEVEAMFGTGIPMPHTARGGGGTQKPEVPRDSHHRPEFVPRLGSARKEPVHAYSSSFVFQAVRRTFTLHRNGLLNHPST